MARWRRFAVLLIMLGALASPAMAHGETLGTVHFPVFCSPPAQQQFERALAMLHSFFFPETVKAFTTPRSITHGRSQEERRCRSKSTSVGRGAW